MSGSDNPSGGSDLAAAAVLPQRVVAAWAANDAEAFASVFTEDGTMILPGVFRKGQEEIRAFMTESFDGDYRGTRVAGRPLAAQQIADGVVALITEGGVLAEGESVVSPEQAIRATWVAVRRDGGWRLAAYQNSPRDAR